MDAYPESFTFLFNAGRVEIPFFQRGYVWNKDNWEDLLADLLDFNKLPFLGSLILKQERSKVGDPRKTMVIDGQQRLTSLSILVKALYDTVPIQKRKNFENDIRKYLFYKKRASDDDYLIKIEHSHIDKEIYGLVICAGIENDNKIETANDANSKILKCYNYFVDELNNHPENVRIDLLDKILHPESKMLVVIDLNPDDDEQAIFDTINSAGVRLSCSDIVKNALFQRAIQLSVKDRSEAIDLYNKTWNQVFLVDDETRDFWDDPKRTGRLNRDNLEILLHSIAVIKGFYDPDNDKLSDLSKLYKEQIVKCDTMDEVCRFIREIMSYADIYEKEIPSFNSSTLFSFIENSLRLFHILDVLQISTFHPLILYVFKEHATDDNRRNSLLSCLEKFIVRRMISNQETRSYSKLCRDFISNCDSLIEATKKTTDEEISRGLKAIGNKNAALLLFWIELRRRMHDNKVGLKELKYNYSLEHVMPQKWEEYWQQIPVKYNLDGSIMSHEDAKEDRKEKINWIGNMTLLTGALNSALRNYDFHKKMEGEGRKKGIRVYDDLYITKEDIVQPYDDGDKVWNEDKIVSRTSRLTQEILQIWGQEQA